MKNKEESKVRGRIIKYIAFTFVTALCIVNFVLLVKVKNGLYDTFHASNVWFVAKDDGSYQITFKLISEQGKSYPDKELGVYFKCYDENGVMLLDDLTAVLEDGDYLGTVTFYDSDHQQAHANEIDRCELNYVEIYN